MASIPSQRRENKFKAFFRSRSRSRSRSRPPDPMQSNFQDSHSCPLSTPPLRPTHLPQRDVPSSSDVPPSSYLKSSVRSQNRPISSTTTNTHSTITPLPSDSLRNRNAARHAYAYHSHSIDTHTPLRDHDQYADTCDYDSDDNNFPRSETPSSTRRKLLWHSFFPISLTRRSSSSISTPHHSTPSPESKASTSTSTSDPKITSSRKRSFRFSSRPTTPKSVDDSSSSKSPYSIPTPSNPLPLTASPRRRSFGLGNSQRSTPKSSTGHLPLPPVQNPQPGRSHGRRHSVGSERPPHDSAVALPEEPSRSLHKPAPDGGGRIKGKERELPVPVPVPDPIPSFDFPSQSLPADPSRNHLLHLPRHPAFSHLPTVDSASSEENDLSSNRLRGIPKIVHTPPTPQRPGGETDSPSQPSNSLPRVDSSRIEIPAKGKKTVAIAHREQVLVSSSRSHPDAQHTTPSKGRFTSRFLSSKDVPKPKDGDAQKSRRRPATASHDAPTHKILGPSRNMTSHRGKLGSFDFERPVSALNRSNSTRDRQKLHGPTDSAPQSSSRLNSLEQTASEDSARGAKSRLNAHQADSPMLKPDHTGDTSVISFSSVSLQTKSTGKDGPTGQSSSWGRASGRRILRTSHGTFAFEHPSTAPNSPDPRAFNLPNEPSLGDLLDHTQSQPSTLLYGMFDARGKHSRGQSYNTPVHGSHSNPGERKSKGKGRSLDLGLGLAWAPSRLREEILMPGLMLAREKAKLEKIKASGSDVTKMFESLLSESHFQTFKKYVRRFDAHVIPLEGPSGLLARVEKLLAESGLNEQEREKLMSEFTVFAQSHGG